MNSKRYRELPEAVKRRLDKFREDLAWCKLAGDQDGLRYYVAQSDGYLFALLDLEVISKTEMEYLKGAKK